MQVKMWNLSTWILVQKLCCECIADARHDKNKHAFLKLNVDTDMDLYMKLLCICIDMSYWWINLQVNELCDNQMTVVLS
jgi:hypothetical protein